MPDFLSILNRMEKLADAVNEKMAELDYFYKRCVEVLSSDIIYGVYLFVIISFAKQQAANSNHITAFFHCHLKITAHSH